MPNIKRKSLEAAKATIKAHACEVGKITHSFSMKVKKGHAISQKPRPHKRHAYRAKVSLVISRGPHS